MKYVALLSGGKDSCFNLSHCQHNNHHLVAAATLSPHSGKADEIDSYMYQTVGQDAIALIGQALDVPLYQRVIQGQAVEQGAEYGVKSAGGGGIAGDETEDLHALLKDVLDHHPDIQAVSVGAILSNYQRVRVEHVCRRLSLTPLAYLWQRNQSSLLSEMVSSHLNAILIKVAGAGLTPSDLGKSLSSMQTKLSSLHKKFGAHPCGEGGEYETFTINGPLFKRRVDIREVEAVVLDPSEVAPVAYLRIKQAVLVEREEGTWADGVPVPPLLEDPFERVRLRLEQFLLSTAPAFPVGTDPQPPPALLDLGPYVRTIGSWVAVGNVRLPPSHPPTSGVGEEVTRCFELLQDLLARNSPQNSNFLPTSATITLLLPSLDAPIFSAANTAYASFFGASPPARACVGVGGVGVGMDCLAWMRGETGARKALHVQSLSYWAPANIGPYSQAISIPPYTFISGQIGLLPASLTLPSAVLDTLSTPPASPLPLETALALQHTARVIRASPNSGLGGGGWIQLAIYYLVHTEDVTHVQMGVGLVDGITPTLYAVLSSLPRGARIEKQVLVHSGRFIDHGGESLFEDTEEEETVVDKPPEFVNGSVSLWWHPEARYYVLTL
ncbi:adenine nucleotide alpha hydrolases-like protein [Paxillus ammoniavirescens]|nr:adenine nucleotide alpha hydrolases-like protein [Paxillus ammoniavirescens]